MTGCRDHNRCGDRVGVHARLRVVVKRDESPVGYNTRDALATLEVCADDKIFHCGCVHHHDVRKGQDARQNRGSKESSVLDDHESTFVFVGDSEFPQEPICGLADDLS